MLLNGSVVDPNPTFHPDADPVRTLNFEGSGSSFLWDWIYRPSRLQCWLPQLEDEHLGSGFSLWCGSGSGFSLRIRIRLYTLKDPAFYSAGFTDPHGASLSFHSSPLMRTGIRLPKTMRIYADPGEYQGIVTDANLTLNPDSNWTGVPHRCSG
jgi:hypothetical protein